MLPGGTEMVMPGDNLKFTVELIAPIAMEEKLGLPSEKADAPSDQASSPKSSHSNYNKYVKLTLGSFT